VAGEPNNDEYMATLVTPASGGDYDFAFRFSGDIGSTWLYGDKDTGAPGEDGSENGYQPGNAGKMFVKPACCIAPDNGNGTIVFPPGCPYDYPGQPMMIIDGLAPGTTIELRGPWTNFTNVVNVSGGSLGGEICSLDAEFVWQAVGTGELAGFIRNLVMPVSGEIHIGPRTPGDSVQTFAADVHRIFGELFGDPDFCALRIIAGSDYGLPGPGFATLTELPSGDFAVDSFFDIAYQVYFEGCPGSQLEDYSGTTTHTVHRSTCYELAGIPVDDPEPEQKYRLALGPAVPNPFGSFTTVTYSVPGGSDSRVSLKIYDARGRLVRELVDCSQPAGAYHVAWDGADGNGERVASGIYFCRLHTSGGSICRRVVLLR
jgi:hypothetical protein